MGSAWWPGADSYLTAASDFGALASRTLVAEAVSKIADIPGHATDASSAPTPRIDDRQALNYMHDVLGDLAE